MTVDQLISGTRVSQILSKPLRVSQNVTQHQTTTFQIVSDPLRASWNVSEHFGASQSISKASHSFSDPFRASRCVSDILRAFQSVSEHLPAS